MPYFLAKDITRDEPLGTFETYHLAFEAVRKASGYTIGWNGKTFYSTMHNTEYIIMETSSFTREHFLTTFQKANR